MRYIFTVLFCLFLCINAYATEVKRDIMFPTRFSKNYLGVYEPQGGSELLVPNDCLRSLVEIERCIHSGVSSPQDLESIRNRLDAVVEPESCHPVVPYFKQSLRMTLGILAASLSAPTSINNQTESLAKRLFYCRRAKEGIY